MVRVTYIKRDEGICQIFILGLIESLSNKYFVQGVILKKYQIYDQIVLRINQKMAHVSHMWYAYHKLHEAVYSKKVV